MSHWPLLRGAGDAILVSYVGSPGGVALVRSKPAASTQPQNYWLWNAWSLCIACICMELKIMFQPMCFQAKFHAKLSSGSEALHTSSQKAWLDAQHHSEGRVFGVLQKVHHIQNPYRFIVLVRWKHKLRKSCLPKTLAPSLADSYLSIIPGAAATWQWGHTNTDPGTGLGGWWWCWGGEGRHQKCHVDKWYGFRWDCLGWGRLPFARFSHGHLSIGLRRAACVLLPSVTKVEWLDFVSQATETIF